MLTQGFERMYAPSRASQSCMSGELDGSCGREQEAREKHQSRTGGGAPGAVRALSVARSCQRHSQWAGRSRGKGCGAQSEGGAPCGVSRQRGGPPAGEGAPRCARVSTAAKVPGPPPRAPRPLRPVPTCLLIQRPVRVHRHKAQAAQPVGVPPAGASVVESGGTRRRGTVRARVHSASHAPGALQEVSRQQAAPLLVAQQVAHDAKGRLRRHVAVVQRRLRLRGRRELHAAPVLPAVCERTGWRRDPLPTRGAHLDAASVAARHHRPSRATLRGGVQSVRQAGGVVTRVRAAVCASGAVSCRTSRLRLTGAMPASRTRRRKTTRCVCAWLWRRQAVVGDCGVAFRTCRGGLTRRATRPAVHRWLLGELGAAVHEGPDGIPANV